MLNTLILIFIMLGSGFGYSDSKDSFTIVDNAIGIISLNDLYEFGDTIFVYDDNHKPLKHITINDEKDILVLKCISISEDFYIVLIEDDQRGLINKSQKNIDFYTWEDHLLKNVFSVGFDSYENPILSEPNGGETKVKIDSDMLYMPVEVQNEWLQIKWGNEKHWEYGWIKWRDNGKLLIELFYFA